MFEMDKKRHQSWPKTRTGTVQNECITLMKGFGSTSDVDTQYQHSNRFTVWRTSKLTIILHILLLLCSFQFFLVENVVI